MRTLRSARALAFSAGKAFLVSLFLLGPVAFAEAPVAPATLSLSRVEGTGTQVVAQRILAEVYRRAGLRFHATPMPAQRAARMSRNGQTDGEVARIASFFTTRPDMLRIEPAIYETQTSVFARRGSEFSITQRKDLVGLRVGIVRGVLHAQAAVAGLGRLEEVSSYEQLYRMLESGRLDVVVDTPLNHSYVVHALELRNTMPVGNLGREPLYHALARKHADAARKISEVLSEMQASGELQRLAAAEEAAFLSGGEAP
jgi:hypothetical protein